MASTVTRFAKSMRVGDETYERGDLVPADLFNPRRLSLLVDQRSLESVVVDDGVDAERLVQLEKQNADLAAKVEELLQNAAVSAADEESQEPSEDEVLADAVAALPEHVG